MWQKNVTHWKWVTPHTLRFTLRLGSLTLQSTACYVTVHTRISYIKTKPHRRYLTSQLFSQQFKLSIPIWKYPRACIIIPQWPLFFLTRFGVIVEKWWNIEWCFFLMFLWIDSQRQGLNIGDVLCLYHFNPAVSMFIETSKRGSKYHRDLQGSIQYKCIWMCWKDVAMKHNWFYISHLADV